jgi:adenosine/AMP kinase
MELGTVRIETPEALNFILGHYHFIKTVEDLHEALVQAGAHLTLGLAFCESSDPCLIRRSGNDAELVRLAVANAAPLVRATASSPGAGRSKRSSKWRSP